MDIPMAGLPRLRRRWLLLLLFSWITCHNDEAKATATATDASTINHTQHRHRHQHHRNNNADVVTRHRRQYNPGAVEYYYYENEASNQQEYGSWSGWATRGECTRSCGGGIAYQLRQCLSAGPDGYPDCIGASKRYYSCNIHDCPETVDIRAEQCSVFDSVPFDKYFYTWVPYTKGQNKCELNCMPRGERFYYRHKKQVIDGTPCDDEKSDICVNGKCLPIGCDRLLGSPIREDKCRICGGNGTECNTIHDVLSRNDLQVGYNDLLLIPAGAMNIKIRQLKYSNNYLAVRNLSNFYYLNGGWRIDVPKSFRFAGTIFHYDRLRDTLGFSAIESISALGPIAESLYIVVLYQEKKADIEYEYSVTNGSIKATDADGYQWLYDGFSNCSVTCGGGYKNRKVWCARKSNQSAVVSDNLCDPALEPIRNQSCAQEACPPSWIVGEWSKCSHNCGTNGTQNRTVKCEQILANGKSSTVDGSYCETSIAEKPNTSQPCNVGLPCPKWYVGPWKACDKLCGDGFQTREIKCYYKIDGKVRIVEDDGCSDPKPESKKPCFIRPCEGVDWIVTEWSDCKDKCDVAFETRNAVCSSAKGKLYPDSFCKRSKRPELIRECQTPSACEYQWYATQWSECSSTCGEGIQSRKVFCGFLKDELIQKVNDSKCDINKKYSTSRNCSGKAQCDGEWFYGPWNTCSKICGGGVKNRIVLCMLENKTADVTKCKEEKIVYKTDSCNDQACGDDEIIPVNATSKIDEGNAEEECVEYEGSNVVTISADILPMEKDSSDGSSANPEIAFLMQPEIMTIRGDSFDFSTTTTPEDATASITSVTRFEISAVAESESSSSEAISYDIGSSSTDSSSGFTSDRTDSSSSNTDRTDSSSTEISPITSESTDSSSISSASTASSSTESSPVTSDSTGSSIIVSDDPKTTESTTAPTSNSDTNATVSTTEDVQNSTETSSTFTTRPSSDGSDYTTLPSIFSIDSSSTSWTPSETVTVSNTETTSTSEMTTIRSTIFGITDTKMTTTRKRCKTKKKKCEFSEFGCCFDGITPATGPFSAGCAEISTCKETKYGCCPDQVTPAEGPKNENCVEINCEFTLFGCCPDNVSAAQGNDGEGCPIIVKSTTPSDNDSTSIIPNRTTLCGDDGELCVTEDWTTTTLEYNCSTSQFGCCPDNETIALGPNFSGCPEFDDEGSGFGIINSTDDGYTTPAFTTTIGDENPYNSTANGSSTITTTTTTPIPAQSNCSSTEFGCCADNQTAARGVNMKGCCLATTYGCCPDDITPAQGSNLHGCGCQYTPFGCCSDGITEASDESRVCTCNATRYGCCPDGVQEAQGENYAGCLDISKAGEICILPKDKGSCRDFTVKWFFDTEYGGCSRFWYGGCEGNDNRFKTQDDCRKTCVEPPAKVACYLPKIAGPCDGYYPSWYYDSRRGQCLQFIYGGCLGNNNKFQTLQDCEMSCSQANHSARAPQMERLEETDVTVEEGNYATLRCRAYGFPTPIVTWKKDGYPIDRSTDRYRFSTDGLLQIEGSYAADSGTYTCTAENGVGQPVQANLRLIVKSPSTDRRNGTQTSTEFVAPAVITTLPTLAPTPPPTPPPSSADTSPNRAPRIDSSYWADVVAEEGSYATLKCAASGFPPPTIMWQRGTTIIDKSDGRYKLNDGVLLIIGLYLSDAGSYDCIADNGVGQADRREYRLSVKNAASNKSADIITDSVSSVIATLEAPSVLHCYAYGYPRPSVFWWREDKMLPRNSALYEQRRDNSLVIRRVTLKTLGPYTCEAYNGFNKPVSWTTTLHAVGPASSDPDDFKYLIYLVVPPPPPIDNSQTALIPVHHFAPNVDNTGNRPMITATPPSTSTPPGIYISPNCTDSPLFANCELIVKGNYCNHKYYGKFCCRSCTLGLQTPLDIDVR